MTIHTDSTSLRTLISGRRIIVPKIQRAYSWAAGNTTEKDASSVAVSALYEDLLTYHKSVLDGADYGYYLGSLIILVEQGKTDCDASEWQLLDGQQRVTTLSLLFNEIYKRLQLYDEDNIPGLVEILKVITSQWINLDTECFDSPEDKWTWALYPRRETDREIYRKLMEHVPLPDIKESMLKTASEEFNQRLHDLSVDELLAFTNTLLDKVVLSVIITDEQSMAYQMFQTANARGTPLTSLDLFRSTVVKRAEAELKLSEEEMKGIMQQLDLTETWVGMSAGQDVTDIINAKPMNEKVTKAMEKITKKIIESWVGCRTGEILSSGLIAYITKEINDCHDFKTLQTLVKDLQQHSWTWYSYIQITPQKRSRLMPFQPIFNIVSEQWKWLGLGVENLRVFTKEHARISDENLDAILQIKTWWAIGNFAVISESNKTPFRGWAKEANMAWKHNNCAPQLGTIIWDKKSFQKRCEDRLGDIQFDSLNTPFSAIDQTASGTFDEPKLSRARAILAMFEIYA